MPSPRPDARAVYGSALEPWIPLGDVFSEANDLVIRVVLPGVRLEDVDLGLSGRRLLVSGLRREPCLKPRQAQWSYSSFKREFKLPSYSGTGEMSAEFRKDTLEIRLHGDVATERSQ